MHFKDVFKIFKILFKNIFYVLAYVNNTWVIMLFMCNEKFKKRKVSQQKARLQQLQLLLFKRFCFQQIYIYIYIWAILQKQNVLLSLHWIYVRTYMCTNEYEMMMHSFANVSKTSFFCRAFVTETQIQRH